MYIVHNNTTRIFLDNLQEIGNVTNLSYSFDYKDCPSYINIHLTIVDKLNVVQTDDIQRWLDNKKLELL